jgi:hypothetical protein
MVKLHAVERTALRQAARRSPPRAKLIGSAGGLLPAVWLTNVVPTTRLASCQAKSLRAAGAQQSSLRGHTKHHSPALLLWCNGLLRGVSRWAPWRDPSMACNGSGGSSPLSSTRHDTSPRLPLRTVVRRMGRWRSLHRAAVPEYPIRRTRSIR